GPGSFGPELQGRFEARPEPRDAGNARSAAGTNSPATPRRRPERSFRFPSRTKKKQAARTREFKKRNRDAARDALAHLKDVARSDKNLFEALIEVVEVATLGQVTHALWEVFGRFRPSM